MWDLVLGISKSATMVAWVSVVHRWQQGVDLPSSLLEVVDRSNSVELIIPLTRSFGFLEILPGF
jgi:hypothetical protein